VLPKAEGAGWPKGEEEAPNGLAGWPKGEEDESPKPLEKGDADSEVVASCAFKIQL
jgi:hypothetical protein